MLNVCKTVHFLETPIQSFCWCNIWMFPNEFEMYCLTNIWDNKNFELSSMMKNYFSFTGTASVARAYSGYIDSLIDKRMATAFRSFMPIDISFLSPYPDFCAFVITLSLTLILCIGVKESTRFNNIFTCLNICVVVFVTFCGWITADFNNWRLEPTEKYVVILIRFFLQ